METEQAQAAAEPKAAPSSVDGGNAPQIDMESITIKDLSQLDRLFEGKGSAELPVKSGGEEKKGQDTSKAKAPEAAKAGDEPPKVVEEAKVEENPPAKVEGEEVVETRSAEEIEAAEKAEADRVAAEKAKEQEPEAEKSKRYRVKDPIARAALELFKTFEDTDTPITLAEAEKRVRGDAPPKKEEAAKVDLKEVVGTLETEVAGIEKKLEEAGSDEGLYTPDIAKLTVEHTRKVAALEAAKRDLKEEAEVAQLEAEEKRTAFKATVAKSRARAIEVYPTVGDDSTPLGKAVAERIVQMRSPDHPDHNLLFTGSAPEVITRMMAEELGIAPVAKKVTESPPQKKPAAPPIVKKVDPVSGAKSAAGKGPKPEDAKNTVEYLKSDKASLEDLDGAFGAGQNPLLQLAI